MCRMLAIKNFCYTKHKEIIEKFFLLAEHGKIPPNNPKGHLDGWGIGWYDKNSVKLYKSGRSVVEEKEKFFSILNEIKETKILIIHFRKSAWPNTNSPKNSHPFKYKNILFAHNGTIYDYKELLKYIKTKITNSFDSEVFFNLLLTNYNGDLPKAFKAVINIIKKECKYSSLTCIFSDGKNLYTYRNFTKLSNYYTLYFSETDTSLFICSEQINDKLYWKILEKNKLFIF